MNFRKNRISNYILVALTITTLSACTLEGNLTQEKPQETYIFPQTILSSTPEEQSRLKQAWLETVSDITRGTYYSFFNVWGPGPLDLFLWFKDGDMWDAMINVDNLDYVLYCMLDSSKYPIQFISSNTAIMIMAPAASPLYGGNLYIVTISNNTIYRSKNIEGLGSAKNWDKKTIPQHDMVSFAKQQRFQLADKMITKGHDITHTLQGVSKTIKYNNANSSIQDISEYISDININGTHIYLDKNVFYKNANDVVTYEYFKIPTLHTYTMTINNHNITHIKETQTSFLGPHIFVNMSYASYIVNINGEQVLNTVMGSDDVSLKHSEGHILSYSAYEKFHPYLIPIDTRQKLISPTTSYNTGNTNVSISFHAIGKIKSITLDINNP